MEKVDCQPMREEIIREIDRLNRILDALSIYEGKVPPRAFRNTMSTMILEILKASGKRMRSPEIADEMMKRGYVQKGETPLWICVGVSAGVISKIGIIDNIRSKGWMFLGEKEA